MVTIATNGCLPPGRASGRDSGGGIRRCPGIVTQYSNVSTRTCFIVVLFYAIVNKFVRFLSKVSLGRAAGGALQLGRMHRNGPVFSRFQAKEAAGILWTIGGVFDW